MGIKKGYLLSNIEELPQRVKKLCSEQHIATAEEFLGFAWAWHGEGVNHFCEFLGVDQEDLDLLVEIVSRYIEPEVLERMRELRDNPPRYEMGARLDRTKLSKTVEDQIEYE